jgi:hypothetical protein
MKGKKTMGIWFHFVSSSDSSSPIFMFVLSPPTKSFDSGTKACVITTIAIYCKIMPGYPNDKEHQNPVQVDTDMIFLYRSMSLNKNDGDSPKKATTMKRHNSRELERKMRQKTAHIGRKASHASQGISWNPFA